MEPKRQRNNQTPVLVVLCVVLALAQGAPVKPWSWETISSFVHCSNHSGPLNKEITQLMAASSFAVIEKYQCLECEPKEHGGEGKVLAAAAQIRAVNPDAAVFLYFAVDYTRTWYNLGSWFDAHPELEVHNADGSLTTVHQHDDGNNTWHVFDFAKTEAVEKWVGDVAATVTTGQLDGIFIDGYRFQERWVQELIPNVNASEAKAWLAGAWAGTGQGLAKALPDKVRIPNGNQGQSYPRGYNAISLEFFGAENVELLQGYAANKTFVEVHSYIGDNRGLFNTTLAAYLIAAGENAYFGAGNTWDTCESWLVDYQIAEYAKQLGAPLSDAVETTRRIPTRGSGADDGDMPASVSASASASASVQGVTLHVVTHYSRTFASGTHVALAVDKADPKSTPQSCVWWSDGSSTGNNC